MDVLLITLTAILIGYHISDALIYHIKIKIERSKKCSKKTERK